MVLTLTLLCLALDGSVQAPAIEIFSLGEAGFPCWRVPVRDTPWLPPPR